METGEAASAGNPPDPSRPRPPKDCSGKSGCRIRIRGWRRSDVRERDPPRLAGRDSRPPGGLGDPRADADPERALVSPTAGEPGDRGDRQTPPPRDPPLLADQAPGPDRPADIRPRGPGSSRGARAGAQRPPGPD